MSGPSSSLGPPPSLDGLTALLSDNGGESSRSGRMGMNNPPKPLPSTSGLARLQQQSQAPSQTASSSSSAASPRNSAGSTSRRSTGGSTLIDNLRKQARTSLDPSYSARSYVGAASALLEKARSNDLQGQAEQAFVNYLKAAEVATLLPKHAEWRTIVEERGPIYHRYTDFMKNVPDIIQRGHRLEELLIAREEARAKEAEQSIRQPTGSTSKEEEDGVDVVTDQQAAEATSHTSDLAERLGALRVGNGSRSREQSLARLPESHLERDLHSEGRGGQGAPGLSDSRRGSVGTPRLGSPQLEKSGFAGISDGVFTTRTDFNKSYPTLDDFEAKQSRPASPRPLPMPPTAAPATTQAKPVDRPPLPPPAKRDITVEQLFPILFPGFETVADEQYGQRLVRRQVPKVLLLDVRPRDDFDNGHIKGADVICLEPNLLSSGMAADELAEAARTPSQRELCHTRNSYDIIIICDRDGLAVTGAVEIVYRAISADEGRRSPSRSPTYLIGGVERWSRKMGEQGLTRTESATSGATPEGRNGRPTSLSLQSGDTRSKRQAMYVASPGTPAALLPGNAAGRARNGIPASSSADFLDSPAMPARAYQTAGTSSTSSLTRQTPAFDYPQLNGAPAIRPSYTNGLGAPPPPPAAAAVNGAVRTPGYEGPQPVYDVARRPTVPPPGGAPVNIRQYSRIVPRVETNVRVGLTGLKNVGNSCYMNSILQCLSATIPLSRFFLDGSYKGAINRVNPLGTQGALAEAFAQLIRVMWSEQYTFVSPVTFREAITRFAPSFRGYEQHDAQEFLAFLLDGLHEDLNYVKQKPPPVEMTPERENELETLPQQIASVKEWAIYRERNDSLIVDWFQGQFRNKLTCLTCGKTSTTYNAFQYLSLPIPPVARGNKVTLYQCLEFFVRTETLEKSNAWHCPRCGVPRRATKKLTISRLPQVLLIHLKRFSFKDSMQGTYTSKIDTSVTFPATNLDLTNYMPPPLPPSVTPKGIPVSKSQNPPFVYDVFATTHHFGSSSGSGHYTAVVRTPDEKSDIAYKYCDDSRISSCDESKLHGPSCYILWLNRRSL